MTSELVRIIFTGLVMLVLIQQTLQARAGSRRRQAFMLGAIGFGLLAALNAFVLFGITDPLLLTLGTGIALAMLLGSMVALFLAYRSGELTEQMQRTREAVEQEREKYKSE